MSTEQSSWRGIVKVQQSLHSPTPVVLIYSENRQVEFSGPMTPDIHRKLAGRPKVFFLARVVKDQLVLDHETLWQTW